MLLAYACGDQIKDFPSSFRKMRNEAKKVKKTVKQYQDENVRLHYHQSRSAARFKTKYCDNPYPVFTKRKQYYIKDSFGSKAISLICLTFDTQLLWFSSNKDNIVLFYFVRILFCLFCSATFVFIIFVCRWVF